MIAISVFVLPFALIGASRANAEELSTTSGDLDYTIEGKLVIPANHDNFTDIIEEARILVDGGTYLGFLKEDYSFEIKNIASGSYLLQVVHPSINFEPVRVDISSKGGKRARRVNNLQPHLNQQLQYPLRIRPLGPHTYFLQRETWRITDFLMNPMVLTMVLPVLFIMVLSKMMSAEDIAQTQREVQQIQNAARMPDIPELSEVMTSLLGRQQRSQKPQQLKGSGLSTLTGGQQGVSKKKN